MQQLIEGVLSQNQRASLEIVDFIFHIIDPDGDEDNKVIYLDEVKLHAQQRVFFLARLTEIAEGTQYIFKENAVHLKKPCIEMLSSPERFVDLSKEMTEHFSGRHKGQMSAGVFIIATVKYLLKANDWQKLVFLVKMDKSQSFSYTYKIENGKRIAELPLIKNALAETKSAIQKSALIDVSNIFVWDVLAFDKKNPLLGGYYKDFLGVTERQTDSALTRNTHTTVKKWARTLTKEQMPENEDAISYTGRAFNYLNDHDVFDTEEFINTVVRDDDQERKTLLQNGLKEELALAGISGQRFRPQPGSLRGKDKKQVYKTEEGVVITFVGSKEAAGLSTVSMGNNKQRIIIETGNLTIE